MRKTKIVATVGPACQTNETLKKLIAEGVDVFRINASHTDPAGLKEWVRRIRKASSEAGSRVAIMIDLQGPRVRTGRIERSSSLTLRSGEGVTLEIGSHKASGNVITTSCAPFTRMVKKGDPILIDNGAIELRVDRVANKSVECRVIRGGTLGENKGINLPNAPVTLPALTPKDLADLKAASALKADYIALSFVRSADDVDAIQNWMRRNGVDIPVIAKIEKPRAVQSLDLILAKAGGIMVARGDLGIEMGVEKVPGVQKMLIGAAVRAKVPVITATQMLETMMTAPHPSRAEVSDIANAVFDGTDAVMLSGESAIGKYPVEAVRTMRRIIEETEANQAASQKTAPHPHKHTAELRSITQAALYAARELEAKAIMVFTFSGKTAQYVSKLNPQCPVIAVTRSIETLARLNLYRGVKPVFVEHSKIMDATIRHADRECVRHKFLKKGDAVVIVYGRRALPGILYTILIHRVGERDI